ncbi:MAG: Gfo/Idh/MocA family oxidoreductase [Candidatus Izemoplasmatales bacterium]|jgi:predicted dehydrogenase|nr:Gfo/Idh/MocA family oxidoreductase [Candidatus Izemoplasmatales bacterium]MDD4988150.1 Gfo/Idh/MocA family oxidoreductase [Candidatus Izemoplasmatales bacterium]MDD5602416.1 Gfo/Idh/MocA family oxidoreductase [Candidatus Izemoplasmatales bacterium]
MFRWAVCGLGKISHRWVKAANSLPGSKVVAAVSSSKKRAEIYQQKYAMDYALTYDELAMNATLVDAVYVCTNMSDHKRVVELFLKAGIPVLCEKSFALNGDEARSMIDCARQKNILLMEAMWCRLLPANRLVDKMMREKKYGAIQHTTGYFKAGWGHGRKSRVWRHDVGGGSVLDLAVYLVHYTQMLRGSPVAISAHGKVKGGVDRYCDFVFEYPIGASSELHSSLEFPALRESYRIYCEKGEVIVPSFYGARKVIEKPYDGKKTVTRFPKVDGFTYEIGHFMELVLHGKKESNIVPLSTTLEVMELLQEINRRIGVVF